MDYTATPARLPNVWSSFTARTPPSNAKAVTGAAIRNRISNISETRRPPPCECGGFLKPATISFGQRLDPREIERASAAIDDADLVVALGSTLSVQPAASFPLVAAQRGVPYIIINRGATDHDREPLVTLRLEGEVSEIFPAAVDEALT